MLTEELRDYIAKNDSLLTYVCAQRKYATLTLVIKDGVLAETCMELHERRKKDDGVPSFIGNAT